MKSPCSPVDAGDVDDHIDHVTAQLVGLHVHWAAIRCYVDLADHVKEEGLLDARVLRERERERERESVKEK